MTNNHILIGKTDKPIQKTDKSKENERVLELKDFEWIFLHEKLTKYQSSKPKDVLIIPLKVWKRIAIPEIKLLEMIPNETK